jgi:GNAT superfamily N-acetyltransferase
VRRLIEVVPLEGFEKPFFDYLNKDRVRHIFTIYDLKNMREKIKVWIALRNNIIIGYLFEFDRKFVHTHGNPKGIPELLGKTDLHEPIFVIQPNHLEKVKKLFEPVEPADPSSKGKVTTFLVMKTDSGTFKPIIKHSTKRLGVDDLEEVSKSLGDEYRGRVLEAINKGLAFGAYENGLLASCAMVPEILEDVALIRGVFTVQTSRSHGLATSVCSALVQELITLDKVPMLWVSKDNYPALKVYEKLGFKETDIVLLCFKARKI